MGIRINALTETTSPGDTDNGVLDTSAGTRRITWSNIKTAIFGAINGLTSKSTPVGADVIAIGDSAASFAGKKIRVDELLPPCSWRAHTVGGFGSTATKIPYFSTVVTNNPNGKFTITSNDATNGLSITVNTAGLYALSFWFDPGQSDYVGISLNASSVTTSISGIAAAGRLGMQYCPGVNQTASVSVTIRLAVNDVIRPQINTGSFGTAAASGFAMEFVGY